MSFWITDPELFLYAKGTGPDDVHLWRCKKPASSSSPVVPMKPDDFDFVKIVKNHLELIGYMDVWDELDYNRLVKYIYEKRFLVNIQGFVIAELLHKADKDGNKTIDDANEEDVPAIYIQSLDVLPLKPYIPNLTERPIPLRTVKYLGDVNGKAAMMEEDSNVTKLTARVADLESKNKTLDTNVTKLTAENKTLDTNVTKLIAGQVAMTDKIDDLVSKNKTLEGKVTKLTADLVTLMNKLSKRDDWMIEPTSSELVGVEGLNVWGSYGVIIVGSLGTFTVDDTSTNVRARYWSKIKSSTTFDEFRVVCIEDLTPNKEMARFSKSKWSSFKLNGKTYAVWGPL